MNIWLINPYDELPGEGPEQRYARLARELAKQANTGEAGKNRTLNIERPTSLAVAVRKHGQANFEGLKAKGCSAAVLAEKCKVVWISSAFRHRGKHAERVGDRNLPFDGLRVYEEMEDGGSSAAPAVKLVLVDAPSYQKNVSLRRLWSQWVWGRNVEREMARRVESGELEVPDIVLASSPPLEGAWAAIRLARRFGAKSVVDFMDDWPATWAAALRAGRWEMGDGRLGRLLLWPWFRLARKVYSSADAVSAQSHTFAERARELGYEGEVYVCYLGGTKSCENANIEHSTSNIEHRSLATQSPLNPSTTQPFSIIYLGSMGRIYDIDTILRAAVLAKEEGLDWRWTLAGEDPNGEWSHAADAYGVSDVVEFPGYVTKEDKMRLLQRSDLGLIPMDPASRVAVPYKAGDYLSAGLPIVNSLPGELSFLLREAGAGVDYRFGDPVSLLARIRSFSQDSTRNKRASEEAQRLFEMSFNREKTYRNFADWVINQR